MTIFCGFLSFICFSIADLFCGFFLYEYRTNYDLESKWQIHAQNILLNLNAIEMRFVCLCNVYNVDENDFPLQSEYEISIPFENGSEQTGKE